MDTDKRIRITKNSRTWWCRLFFSSLCLSVFLLWLGSAAAPPDLDLPLSRRGPARQDRRGHRRAAPSRAGRCRPGPIARASRSSPRRTEASFTVTVAADAVPGVCWVRLHDEQGASELRPFLVGNAAGGDGEGAERRTGETAAFGHAAGRRQWPARKGRRRGLFRRPAAQGRHARRLAGSQPHARLADGRRLAGTLRRWIRAGGEQRRSRTRPANRLHRTQGWRLHCPHFRLPCSCRTPASASREARRTFIA